MTPRLRLALVLCTFAPAAAAQWAPTAGPMGAAFHHLAATDAGVVLGASSAGPLFRFNDGEWARTSVTQVRGILATGSDVYLSDFTSLHHSTDGGMTFTVAPLPGQADVVGADGAIVFAEGLDSLYSSADGGASWASHHMNSRVTIELPGQPPTTFPVVMAGVRGAALEDDGLYAAATVYIFGDVYRLAPGDSLWRPVLFRSTDPQESRFVSDMVRFGGALYVASTAGVHASQDGGATWQDVSDGIDPADLGPAGDLLPGASLYGHFGSTYYRLDGLSWTPLAQPPGIPLSDAAGDRLYTSTLDVVVAHRAAGWEELPRPAASTPVLMHASGQTVLAAAGGRLHRTENAGASWAALALTGLSGPAHVGPSAMFAAVNSASGIARSLDQGQTWSPATRPATPASAGPIVPRRFASAGAASYAAYAHERFGDHGEPLGQYGGVFQTTDGGQSWTDVSAGLPVASLGPFPIGVLYSDGATLLAQAGNGTCHRRESGTWQGIACPGGAIESFASHAGNWYAVSPAGAFLSADRGSSWAPASAGVTLPADPNQHAAFWRAADLVATPSDLLLVTQFLEEVRAYRFDGAWQSVELGFPAGFRWTGFSSGSETLFGGVRDGGVWSVPLGVITAPAPPAEPPDAFALAAPVPNPAAGRVRVGITLPRGGPVAVDVYDALGRLVATLHRGVMGAGPQFVEFDADGLSPGAYVVRASSDSGSAARRFTVVR